MDATEKLLPVYEELTEADSLNEEERDMLEQIRQTLYEVLEFSGMMIGQLEVMQFENAVDFAFSPSKESPIDGRGPEIDQLATRQQLVAYLQSTANRQLN